MQTVTVQGTTIPKLGFGTWELTGDTAYDAVRSAIATGYRHIDTAQAYGNEAQVGKAVRDADVDRDDLFVTTKVWRDNAAADDVKSSTHESLDELGLDHVDLLLLHWPSDEFAPLEETIAAMDELREAGVTRLIGVSNFPADRFREAAQLAPLATNQVEYHPFLGQDELLAAAAELDSTITAYSPLGHGRVFEDDRLEVMGQRHGRSAANIALRWLLDQDRVLALPRSSDPDHIASNFDLDFELSDDERSVIDGMPKDDRQIDPDFAPEW